MKPKYLSSILATTLLALLLAGSCFAGWGDALKDAGSQLADEGATAAGLPYTPSEAMAGIKEVLSLSTESAVSNLGKSGGFSDNPAVSIPMPDMLKGLGDPTGLVSSMNKAAEAAVPSTGNIFLDAIQNLNIGDPTSLLGGADNAITKYFEDSSRGTLKSLVKPVVSGSLDAAGVGSYLNTLTLAQQAANPGAPPFDAVDYVTDKTLDGMFHLMAEQEKSIRSGGGAGASELLQKLF